MQMKDASHAGCTSSSDNGAEKNVVAGDVVQSVSEQLISRGGSVPPALAVPYETAAAA